MLGLTDIETISHRLEDMFGAAKKGAAALTPETIDSFYKGLDAIKRLVNEAIKESSEQKKMESEVKVTPEYKREAEDEEKAKIPPSPPFVKGGMGGVGEFKIDTVRVDTKRLDALMTQVGELSVTKGRIAQRLVETEGLVELWESLEGRIQKKGILDSGSWILDSDFKSKIPHSTLKCNTVR